MNRRLLVAAICLVSTCLEAPAAEFFVAATGHDDAAGTDAAHGFDSVRKGVSVLKPGDTLTILPGEYPEAVEVRKLSGRKEAPITIRAQRGGTVVLRGDVEVTGWAPVVGMACVFAVPFDRAVQGVADPRIMAHYAPAATLAEVEINPGAFFHEAPSKRLLVRPPDGRLPGVLSVSVTNGNGIALEDCAHIIVEGLTFTGYQHADNTTLFGSRTRWGFIATKSAGITVRHCAAYLNSGGFCLTSNTTDSIIEECEAFGNASRTVGISNQILGWGVKDCIFRSNRIEGFDSPTGSRDQITFYSNGGSVNVLERNVAIRGGYMDKGDAENVRVTGNLSTGPRPQYYKPPDASNLSVSYNEPERVADRFADPVNGDFRLLSDSPLRGKGLKGSDPGPFPFREQTFFVSPAGDDSATGLSPQKPWKTLKHAAARAKAGETVYLLPGVYHESLVPGQSGTQSQPIRFARRGDGRVILEGHGKLPVGIDLSGRSFITVEGLVVQNFAQEGVRAEAGTNLTFSHLLIGAVGSDAVAATGVRDMTLRHCFIGRVLGAGVRLKDCSQATVTGNVFGVTVGPRLHCDADTLATLWSDRNNFVPAEMSLIQAAEKTYGTVAEWQQAAKLDPHSLTVDPGLDPQGSGGGGLRLRADSALIGRGPRGAAIGPFRRLTKDRTVPIQQPRLHSATATTANLECDTPSMPVAMTLQWGETPAFGQSRPSSAGIAHSISLTGLKPGATYHARFVTEARETQAIFGTDRETLAGADEQDLLASALTFTTPAAEVPTRTFHVAATGDDGRDGSTLAAAWRTLNRAAAEAKAGDTVLVHGGVYEELVTVRGTGEAGTPVTFRAAPGAVVWLTGSNRLRSTAFLVKEKHHVVIDGFRFRDFLSVESNLERVVAIDGGSHNIVRRCFYDGRVPSGYMNVFLGVTGSADFTVENSVAIQGMGEGMAFKESPRAVVRHCVFYNNNIRAVSVNGDEPGTPVNFNHNLVCAVIPTKGGSPFFRVRQLQNYTADHNGYFDRIPEAERGIVETAFIGATEVGQKKPGAYSGRDLTLEHLRAESGQDLHSIFGNPGIAVVKELSPRRDKDGPDTNRNWNAQWLSNELHQTRVDIQPLDFHHFMPTPNSVFAKSAAGKPIGLDPAAFVEFAKAEDRGSVQTARAAGGSLD